MQQDTEVREAMAQFLSENKADVLAAIKEAVFDYCVDADLKFEQEQPKKRKRSITQVPNGNKRWSTDADATLRTLFNSDMEVADIAKILGRSASGVISRIATLGLDR